MAIANRNILTNDPHNGLSPGVLNVPAFYNVYAGLASSDNVATKTQRTQGSSVAAGTQIDYPRNLQVIITPTDSSAGISAGGGVTVWGRDAFGYTRSESYAGTKAASNASGVSGTVNFASIATISMLLSFHSDTSSAASAYALVMGRGNKIGLPVDLVSSDAVFKVALYTSQKLTSSSDDSTNNAYTVCTGEYWKNGVVVAAVSSASLLQVGYLNLGFRAPYSPVP